MIIKRGITHKINMGNYESVEISAEIEAETKEGMTIELALDILDEMVTPDLVEARKNTDPDASFDSYSTNWRK